MLVDGQVLENPLDEFLCNADVHHLLTPVLAEDENGTMALHSDNFTRSDSVAESNNTALVDVLLSHVGKFVPSLLMSDAPSRRFVAETDHVGVQEEYTAMLRRRLLCERIHNASTSYLQLFVGKNVA